jgi:hypothetical protein
VFCSRLYLVMEPNRKLPELLLEALQIGFKFIHAPPGVRESPNKLLRSMVSLCLGCARLIQDKLDFIEPVRNHRITLQAHGKHRELHDKNR